MSGNLQSTLAYKRDVVHSSTSTKDETWSVSVNQRKTRDSVTYGAGGVQTVRASSRVADRLRRARRWTRETVLHRQLAGPSPLDHRHDDSGPVLSHGSSNSRFPDSLESTFLAEDGQDGPVTSGLDTIGVPSQCRGGPVSRLVQGLLEIKDTHRPRALR